MSSDKTTSKATTSERSMSALMTQGRIIVAVLGVLALIFIFENTRRIKIRLLIPEVTMPLWAALLLTFLIGGLCGLFARRSKRRSAR